MNSYFKHAYTRGIRSALEDFGLLKLANMEQVARNVASGMSHEEAWSMVYPNLPVPEDIEEMLYDLE